MALLVTVTFTGQAANAQNKPARRTVLYVALGPEIIEYDVQVDSGALSRQGAVTVPENVQEAWTSPSKKFLYVAWSNGGPPEGARGANNHHGVSAFRIDPATGALTLQGRPAALPSRPIYITTDMDGAHVLTAHNDPSSLVVHQILPDGSVGAQVNQIGKLDFGIYAHQVRVDPSNKTVILVTRGNVAAATRPENPGALRIFNYKNGVLTPRQILAPNGGFGYQVRHLDFHPSGKWVYATLEAQNRLHVYRRAVDGTLSDRPIFAKSTLAGPKGSKEQAASSIHVHRNVRFVYVANRRSENSIAVFAINQSTGEPTLIQSEDTRGFEPRTFAVDAGGLVLAVANQSPGTKRDGSRIPARLTVFRIRGDGKLEFANQYDFEPDKTASLFWTGIVSLP
jgi:6-phosphogluconolactonase (cycloisomerase 2 family)